MRSICSHLLLVFLLYPNSGSAANGWLGDISADQEPSRYLSLIGEGGLSFWGDPRPSQATGRLMVHAVVARKAQLGGFVGYRHGPKSGDDDLRAVGAMVVGGSGRFGGNLIRSLWMGFDLQIGLTVFRAVMYRRGRDEFDREVYKVDPVSGYVRTGAVLVAAFPVGGASLGVEAGVGMEFIAGGSYENRGSDYSGTGQIFYFGPVGHLGLVVGF